MMCVALILRVFCIHYLSFTLPLQFHLYTRKRQNEWQLCWRCVVFHFDIATYGIIYCQGLRNTLWKDRINWFGIYVSDLNSFQNIRRWGLISHWHELIELTWHVWKLYWEEGCGLCIMIVKYIPYYKTKSW